MQTPNSASTEQEVPAIQMAPENASLSSAPSFPALKEAAAGRIAHAKDTVKDAVVGSGSLPLEVRRVMRDYMQFPGHAVGIPWKFLSQLAQGHPLEAVKKASEEALGAFRDLTDIVSSPGRLAVAGVAGGGRALGGALKAPFAAAGFIAQSPLKIWNALDDGTRRLSEAHDRAVAWATAGSPSKNSDSVSAPAASAAAALGQQGGAPVTNNAVSTDPATSSAPDVTASATPEKPTPSSLPN